MRNPALLTLWGGEFASRIGISVFQIALLWYLLEATADDSLKTGLITMIGFLPAVVVGLWAGVLVDRLEYRAVMLGANLARAALAAALPLLILLAGLPLAGIALMGFLLSSATAFFNPARDAVIPLLAKKHELFSANSLVQSAWQFSLPVGPLLAAVALTFAPVETLFYGVALSFALSFAVLLYLKKVRHRGKSSEPTPVSAPWQEARGGFFTEFRNGWSFLRSERRVFWIWIITALNNFFLMGAVIIGTPVYVKTYLGGTIRDFALVESTYAVGMIVFTWLISRYGDRFNPLRVLFLAMIYDGLSYLPLYWVTTLEGTLLTILVHSLGIPAITISRLTALHRMVPQQMQGRVFSYINLAVDGMTALSIGVVGIALAWLPANVLFAVIGVLAASTGVLGLMLPVFREE
ncbi:MAG: MFS transporter [SAR324 cluster bacterium]|nr:MFS transporter [SAR324 cluster bacterium]